jgi:hypothetical protein
MGHFCACGDSACPLNPRNHDKGCDLCIRKCLGAGEIPSCFFLAVSPDLSGRTDYSYRGFADHVIAHPK